MKVGFIGLGVMGRPMALHLHKAGHELFVWARRPAAVGDLPASVCATPAELGQQCAVVFTVVTSSADVENIALGKDGLIDGMAPGSVLVDCSTIAPEAARKIAARLGEKSIHMLDAPVSGGAQGAIDATLATLAASVSVGSGTVNLSLAGAVSVTTNTITTDTLADIDNSDVDSGGAVAITANAGSEIHANTIAVALSVAAGSGTVTLAGGFAEAIAINSIGGSTQALIEGGSTVDAVGNIGVNVNDSPEIYSNIVAAAVAVSASSGSVSGSLALAVSVAENTIDGSSRASINASDVTSTSGDISVTTLADNQIDAVAAAASGSVAASSSVGVSIAGAGAWAKNVTTNQIEASIVNGSTVDADDSLDVLAVDSSSITARLVSASISVAASSTGAVGVGLSLALTENEIGGTTTATIADSIATAGSGVSVIANDGVTLAELESLVSRRWRELCQRFGL